MIVRSFCYLAVAALLSAIPACAAEQANEDTGASSDEITTNNGGLRSITIMKGTMTEGGQLKVMYEPSLYEPTTSLPFLAVEVLPGVAEADQGDNGDTTIRPQNGMLKTMNVSVAGDFPGSPRVLVVDENFRVLAGANGVRDEFGQDVAQLQVPASSGKKLILVRDLRWVRPMEFMVNVGL